MSTSNYYCCSPPMALASVRPICTLRENTAVSMPARVQIPRKRIPPKFHQIRKISCHSSEISHRREPLKEFPLSEQESTELSKENAELSYMVASNGEEACNYNGGEAASTPREKDGMRSNPLRTIPPLPWMTPSKTLNPRPQGRVINQGIKRGGMERIVERIRRLKELEEDREMREEHTAKARVKEFYKENINVNSLLDKNWISIADVEEEHHAPRLPWDMAGDRQEGAVAEKRKRVKGPTLAELVLPDYELKRLIKDGMELKEFISISKAGITIDVVMSIHQVWRTNELVKLRFGQPYSLNMKRAHHNVEGRTGGMVVYRSGSKVILYRGPNYKLLTAEEIKEIYLSSSNPMQHGQLVNRFVPDISSDMKLEIQTASDHVSSAKSNDINESSLQNNAELGNNKNNAELGNNKELTRHRNAYMELHREFSDMLEGLGPRFMNWWGHFPAPIDADLLPEEVDDFQHPARLLPYGYRKSKLNGLEVAKCRRLAKKMPPHFALGRNRRLQGMAVAILKLWERFEIVKIVLKRGIANLNHKLMAAEIMKYTGGILLLRDKYYIVIHRGKDFLPPVVASVIEEQQAQARKQQDTEEIARAKAAVAIQARPSVASSVAGTLTESVEAHKRWRLDSKEQRSLREAAYEDKIAAAVGRLQRKMDIARRKKESAENQLAKLEANLAPVQQVEDIETVTNEEKYMFRKVGLKMSAFLLLGRRRVFDGVIENMHLHWKHRELVKIISKEHSLETVEDMARMLENESGGILVTVEKVSKGYAMIFYRGKNYQRPSQLRPKNLLNKRRAFKRSVEFQRRQALSFHIYQLERNMKELLSGISMAKKGKIDESRMELDSDDDSEDINESSESMIESGKIKESRMELDSGNVSEDFEDIDESSEFEVDMEREFSFSNNDYGDINDD